MAEEVKNIVTPELKEAIKAAFLANKTRKELAEEYNLPYYTITKITKGMKNDVKMHEGRFEAKKIYVDADLNIVDVSAGGNLAGLTETTTKEWVKRVVEEKGYDRKKIAEVLGISYGGVYSYTKDLDMPSERASVMITLADGTQVPRAKYIRARVAAGADKSALAKELGINYNVIWQATSKKKTDAMKMDEAISVIREVLPNVIAYEEDLTKCVEYLDEISGFERHAE